MRKVAGILLILSGAYLWLVAFKLYIVDLRLLLSRISEDPLRIWSEGFGAVLVLVLIAVLGVLLFRSGVRRLRRHSPNA